MNHFWQLNEKKNTVLVEKRESNSNTLNQMVRMRYFSASCVSFQSEENARWKTEINAEYQRHEYKRKLEHSTQLNA